MIIAATGPFNVRPGTDSGFGRGMQTTSYCGNSPESWVRGSAWLDTATGNLKVVVQLETDSASSGPKGSLNMTIKDSQNRALATVSTPEIATGGKSGSHSAIRNFSANSTISAAIAAKASSIDIAAQCRGSATGLLNLNLNDVAEAFQLVVQIVGAAAV